MARTVLLHYHLFKNAGTSLDTVLRENFGDGWVTKEFDRKPPPAHAREIAEWIRKCPTASAFSSHTIEAPPPVLADIQIIPLIFLRHPIDRIASAYHFERKQPGTGFGAVLARNTNLAGYVQVRLSLERDRQCRNFQVARFAKLLDDQAVSESERARIVLKNLPWVGLVEDFENSMQRLAELIRGEFPNFQPRAVAMNVSKERGLSSLGDRLGAVRASMGDTVYQQLIDANADDLLFYEQGVQRARQMAVSSRP